MLRIIKIALVWSVAIRLIVVCLALLGVWMSDKLSFPASNVSYEIGNQIGRAMVPAIIAIIVAALFYYPKRNAWWEDRGKLPAIITVCVVSALGIVAEISASVG